MIAESRTRVQSATPETINERIRQQTIETIERVAPAGHAAISRRLEELEREWDIDRALQLTAASFVLGGLALGATVSRKWLILPGIVGGFLMQHAIQGWCPPLFVFRLLGYRSQPEIETERVAMKAMRGDFALVIPAVGEAQAVVKATAGAVIQAAESK